MPVISSFFVIIIRMNFREHNPPHLHAEYQGNNAVFNFDGEITEGTMPNKQKKLIVAWIEIHKDELIANWQLIQNKEDYFKIDPLR